MPENLTKTVRLWVKPDLVDCHGVVPQKCLQVAPAEDGDYELFYDSIDGFTHEEGTAYVIDVKVETLTNLVPSDASTLRYTLVSVIHPVSDCSHETG